MEGLGRDILQKEGLKSVGICFCLTKAMFRFTVSPTVALLLITLREKKRRYERLFLLVTSGCTTGHAGLEHLDL
jgi:hypothetical protein